MNDKEKTLNSFWFIFNARKSKKKNLGQICLLMRLRQFKKQHLLGCFWHCRRLNNQDVIYANPFGLMCAQINIGRLTNGIIFTKAASIRSARGKCIYVYALDGCRRVYPSISSYLFAY